MSSSVTCGPVSVIGIQLRSIGDPGLVLVHGPATAVRDSIAKVFGHQHHCAPVLDVMPHVALRVPLEASGLFRGGDVLPHAARELDPYPSSCRLAASSRTA